MVGRGNRPPFRPVPQCRGPEISDAAFDALWDELKRLAPGHPQPSVGAEIEPGSVKVDHRFPMRSLDKETEDADLVHFVRRRRRCNPNSGPTQAGRLRPVLEYRCGRLVRAATRGSGDRGEDVTRNARKVANVPDRLSAPADAHVRGEVVMPLEVFEAKYREVSPNPRNLLQAPCARSMTSGKSMQATSCSMPTTFGSCPQRNNIRIPLLPQATTKTMHCWSGSKRRASGRRTGRDRGGDTGRSGSSPHR